MAELTQLRPIEVVAGVQPDTDRTATSTQHYVASDKIRFVDGVPEKIGGFVPMTFDYNDMIEGTARSLFSEVINGKFYNVIGTNEKLYSLIGSSLENITPFQTASVTAANSLNTHYDALAATPFTAVSGSAVITVVDPDADRFEAGDTVYFSGATGFAGLSAGDLNGDTIVRSIGAGEYTINVGVTATASETGGGVSVFRSSGLITLNKSSHGLESGERVKISGASTTGGVMDTEINNEFIIRNVATSTFEFMTIGEATSAAISGGGGSTVYFPEITAGALDEGNVVGYGAGLYGIGLYGTALVSSASRSFPRIWFMDRYGDTVIATAGNQTGVYQWDGDNAAAPALVPNAPTTVNYAFISDNILVTFGEGNVENRVTGSDQGDIENWVSSSINQVFRDDIEGAGRLTSHCPVEDYSLIFTENKTYRMRYIGLPFVWEIKPLDETIGIIAPMARATAKGRAFWMGQGNFYMYRGGTSEVIPANSQHQSTLRKYVFSNINWGQKSKCFAWYNKDYNEVWFHYPSAESNECDRVVAVNILDFTWMPHTFDRTAAEYPSVKFRNPRMMSAGILYQHENGTDAGSEALAFTLKTNKRFNGNKNINIDAVIPDSITTEDMSFISTGTLYPQSAQPTNEVTHIVSPTTERVPIINSGRMQQYTWQGSELGQSWTMGQWFEEITQGSSF